MSDLTMQIEFLKANLKSPIVLVGLMGAGKTTLGLKLAQALDIKFVDSDAVIVEEQGRSIQEIFDNVGEPYFRDIEKQTIQYMVRNTKGVSKVIGTGGGAFMNDQTRKTILKDAISIFLKADLSVLSARVGSGEGRPLASKLESLMTERYPTYAEADITVVTQNEPVEQTLENVINALYNHCSPA